MNKYTKLIENFLSTPYNMDRKTVSGSMYLLYINAHSIIEE